jgi:hypothetical protein
MIGVTQESGSIRIGIRGEWQCLELAVFLEQSNDVYRRLNSAFVLRQALGEEIAHNESLSDDGREFFWHDLLFGAHLSHGLVFRSDILPYSQLIEVCNSLVVPLTIDAIAYESPGWVQLIGALNPLKVIADFISRLRAENTKREQFRLSAQTERMRIQADLTSQVVSVLFGRVEWAGDASRLVEIVEEIVKPTVKYLDRCGTDIRICESEIVPQGEPLPKRKKSPRKK